jgi:phenol 2-monooxygenase (NADPH)
MDMFKRTGGKGYENYGIDAVKGAIVIVRPDGYVGMVAPLDNMEDVNQYFTSFMKA